MTLSMPIAQVLGDAIATHPYDPALLGLAILAHPSSRWLPKFDQELCARIALAGADPSKIERKRMLTIAEFFLKQERA